MMLVLVVEVIWYFHISTLEVLVLTYFYVSQLGYNVLLVTWFCERPTLLNCLFYVITYATEIELLCDNIEGSIFTLLFMPKSRILT